MFVSNSGQGPTGGVSSTSRSRDCLGQQFFHRDSTLEPPGFAVQEACSLHGAVHACWHPQRLRCPLPASVSEKLKLTLELGVGVYPPANPEVAIMQELCSHRATQSAVIPNLEPNTRYEFMVRLHVDQISSSWSSVVYHQTLPAGNQTIRAHQFPSLSSYLDLFLLFVRLSSACELLDNLKLWGSHAGLGLLGSMLCSSDHKDKNELFANKTCYVQHHSNRRLEFE